MIYTNVLQRPREELLEESEETGTKKNSKCYVANIHIGGVLTSALIHTSRATGRKGYQTEQKIYADLQLPNHIIQVVFLVVPKLSRPCIIGIDLLDQFRNHNDLDSKTISFPHLEGKPSIKIINEEIPASPAEKTHTINSITEIKDDIEIKKRD